MEPTLDQLFIDFSDKRLRQYAQEIEKCLARLNDRQVWTRGSGNENAIGNLILHLCGNVRQRTAAIARREYVRIREEEFSAAGGLSVNDLAVRLRSAVDEALTEMGRLPAGRLTERVVVGEFNQTVLEAIYHMVVHFALHGGQIFFATKMMTGEDLNFYKPPQPATEKAKS